MPRRQTPRSLSRSGSGKHDRTKFYAEIHCTKDNERETYAEGFTLRSLKELFGELPPLSKGRNLHEMLNSIACVGHRRSTSRSISASVQQSKFRRPRSACSTSNERTCSYRLCAWQPLNQHFNLEHAAGRSVHQVAVANRNDDRYKRTSCGIWMQVEK
jgi:hypothetical protein